MPHTQEDPVLTSARREALIVLACWLIAMTWSVSYCYIYGYLELASPIPISELKSPTETLSEQELAVRIKAAKVKVDKINAARLSSKKFVEVRPPATPGGTPALWVDRGQGKERVTFVLGFPSWIFWGVALPWWICTAFALFFGAFLVRDEDLGLDPEAAAEAAGQEVANV